MPTWSQKGMLLAGPGVQAGMRGHEAKSHSPAFLSRAQPPSLILSPTNPYPTLCSNYLEFLRVPELAVLLFKACLDLDKYLYLQHT